jgi:hypothetical protein
MNYGVTGSNLAEKVALALGKVPIPAVDSLLAAIRMRSISSAVRLGVFEALAGGGLARRRSRNDAASARRARFSFCVLSRGPVPRVTRRAIFALVHGARLDVENLSAAAGWLRPLERFGVGDALRF